MSHSYSRFQYMVQEYFFIKYYIRGWILHLYYWSVFVTLVLLLSTTPLELVTGTFLLLTFLASSEPFISSIILLNLLENLGPKMNNTKPTFLDKDTYLIYLSNLSYFTWLSFIGALKYEKYFIWFNTHATLLSRYYHSDFHRWGNWNLNK